MTDTLNHSPTHDSKILEQKFITMQDTTNIQNVESSTTSSSTIMSSNDQSQPVAPGQLIENNLEDFESRSESTDTTKTFESYRSEKTRTESESCRETSVVDSVERHADVEGNAFIKSLVEDQKLFTKVQSESDVVGQSEMKIGSKSDVIVEDLISDTGHTTTTTVHSKEVTDSHENVTSVTKETIVSDKPNTTANSMENIETETEGNTNEGPTYCYENFAVTDEEMMKSEIFEDQIRESSHISADSSSVTKQIIHEEQKIVDEVKNTETIERVTVKDEGKNVKCDVATSSIKTTETIEETKNKSEKLTVVLRSERKDNSRFMRPKSSPVMKSTEIPRPKKAEAISALIPKKVNGTASSDSGLDDENVFFKGQIAQSVERSLRTTTVRGSIPGATYLDSFRYSLGSSGTPTNKKMVRSKIGSWDNKQHSPGGGNVKIMSKKSDYTSVGSKVGSVTNHKAGGGNVKIESRSVDYTNSRSRIGSLDNANHTPSGGNVEILNKKKDYSSIGSKVGSVTNHKAGGGNVKIESKSVDFSNTKSRVGSLDNAHHTPQGGNVKIENKKLDFKERAESKVGSKDNIVHTPGGGDKKIETRKLNFSNMAQSKIGSMDNAKHTAGGGTTKIESHKANLAGVQSKCGSKDNATHKPGGGDKKIETHKIDYSTVHSKIGSKDNATHVAGGGAKKIYDHKEDFTKVQSKCGSADNKDHKAAGGQTKIFDQKEDFTKVQSKCGSTDNKDHKAGGGQKKVYDTARKPSLTAKRRPSKGAGGDKSSQQHIASNRDTTQDTAVAAPAVVEQAQQ